MRHYTGFVLVFVLSMIAMPRVLHAEHEKDHSERRWLSRAKEGAYKRNIVPDFDDKDLRKLHEYMNRTEGFKRNRCSFVFVPRERVARERSPLVGAGCTWGHVYSEK